MSVKNLKIYRDNQEELVTLQEEYRMIGHDTQLGRGVLTVFALRRKKQKPKAEDGNQPRNKRAESHAKDKQKKTRN